MIETDDIYNTSSLDSSTEIKYPYTELKTNLTLLKDIAPGYVVGFWGTINERGGYDGGGMTFIPIDIDLTQYFLPYGYVVHYWDGKTLD